jgi:hypothetical protein
MFICSAASISFWGTVALSDHVPRPGVAPDASRSDRLNEFVERLPDAQAGVEAVPRLRVAAAFDQLRDAI